MIGLMLESARQQPAGFEDDLRAIEPRAVAAHAFRAGDLGRQVGKAEAAFIRRLLFRAHLQLRIEQHERHVFLDLHGLAIDEHGARPIIDIRHVDHRDLQRHADLLRGKTHAVMGAHRFDHIGGELLELVVDLLHFHAFRAEHWVSVFDDFEDHFRASVKADKLPFTPASFKASSTLIRKP